MNVIDKTITKGFLLAGLMNMSVLIFSKFFTNDAIAIYDPKVMSNFGLLMILIWGLAYISVAETYQTVKWLVLVFAIEKVVYGLTWINWLLGNSLEAVFERDLFAGLFYAIYGVNDWIFAIFFLLVFIRVIKSK